MPGTTDRITGYSRRHEASELCNHVQPGQLPRISSICAMCVLAVHNGARTPRSEQQTDTDDMVCAENTR